MATKTKEKSEPTGFEEHVQASKPAKVTPIKKTLPVDDLQAGESTVDVFGDGSLLVTYTLDDITPKLLREARGFAAAGANAGDVDTVDFCVEFISNVVKKWDLLDRAGQPVPLNVEAISDSVPVRMLVKIMFAIMEHVSPPKESAGGSSPSFSGNPKRRPRTGIR